MLKSSLSLFTLLLLCLNPLAQATMLINQSKQPIEYKIYVPTNNDALCSTTVVSTQNGTLNAGKTQEIFPSPATTEPTPDAAICLVVNTGKTTLISQFYHAASCTITYAHNQEKSAHLILTPTCQHAKK